MTLHNIQQGVDSFCRWAADDRPRIGLGIPFIDDNMRGGLAKSECMMVMAVSSVGKTWVALNAIANNPDVPTLFCSLEMSWRQVAARLTAIRTGVPTWDLETEIKAGRKPGAFYDIIREYPLLLCDDRSDQSVKDISAAVRQGSDMLGQQIRLVIIDYLELVSGPGLIGKSEQVDRASQKMRTIAKDNDCSVVVLHQVGKTDGASGAEPLSLESGRYGGHAPMDAVAAAYCPRLKRDLSKQERDEVRSDIYLQLLKNRNGQAHPEGVRHTLSPYTGKISPYGVQLPGNAWQPELDQPSIIEELWEH